MFVHSVTPGWFCKPQQINTAHNLQCRDINIPPGNALNISTAFFLLAPFTWRVIAKSKHKQSPRKRRLARTIDYDFCLSHFGGPCGRRQWMWDRQWSGHPVGPGICCRGLSTATKNWTFRSQLEGQSAGPLRCPLAPRHHQLGATGPARDRWRPHRPETGRRDLAATTSFNSGRFVWLSDHLNWKVFTGAVGGAVNVLEYKWTWLCCVFVKASSCWAGIKNQAGERLLHGEITPSLCSTHLSAAANW